MSSNFLFPGSLLLLSALVFSCMDNQDEQTEILNNYLIKVFDETVEHQDSIFFLISGRGCLNCVEPAIGYFSSQLARENKMTFIMTREMADMITTNYSLKSMELKIDEDNILKRVNLPLEGISKVKIRNCQIDTIYSLPVGSVSPKQLRQFFIGANNNR